MGAVPHSGNKCSGLCLMPCGHPDCWQCAEGNAKLADERAAQQVLAVKNALAKAGARSSILGQMTGQKATDWQKATITRGALEGLAQKAGVRMDWNNGSPVFYDEDIQNMEARYTKAQREVMDRKVKELEDIAKKQSAGILSQQTARSMAEAAGKQMDTMVNDVIKERVNETLREDISNNEQRIIEEMRANGASEDDIEAARLLAGWKPDIGDGEVSETMDYGMPVDPAKVQTIAQLKAMIEDLKSKGINNPTFMIHPDAYEDLGWKSKTGQLQLPTDGITYKVFSDLAVGDVDKT
jgi:hypothetical protein